MWPFARKRTTDRALFNIGDVPVAPTWAGVQVGADAALRLSAVWACVRLLADSVSSLPLDVYRVGERAALETPPLLRRPAAGTTLPGWLYAVMVSLLLRGNAYGIVTARSGALLRPAQVELVHPDRMQVRVTDENQVEYRLGGTVYDPADVWHVKAYEMPGGVVGLSPVEYARQSIGLGLAAERFGAQWFAEGAVPAGVISAPGDIDTEVAEELQDRWMARHRDNRRPAVLSGGATYHPIAVKPEESQFVESQKMNTAAIARIYGVPPEMVAGETGDSLTYSNSERRALDFLVFSLRPWLTRLETAIAELLGPNHYLKFNAGGLLRATTKERYEAHEIGLRAGFLTVAEVRELEDRPPLAGQPTPEPEEAAA